VYKSNDPIPVVHPILRANWGPDSQRELQDRIVVRGYLPVTDTMA
jgi:hypothetical protein